MLNENGYDNRRRTIIIVGAGLSGLTCAFSILNDMSNSKDVHIEILEAKSIAGGRVLTVNGVDLGAAWTWYNDLALNTIRNQLRVDSELQLSSGKALSQTKLGVVKIIGHDISPAGPGSSRIHGGAIQTVNALVRSLLDSGKCRIHYNFEVCEVIEGRHKATNIVTIKVIGKPSSCTSLETLPYPPELEFSGDAIVLAMPPRLIVQNIKFSPNLDTNKMKAMNHTSTWMAYTGKVVFEYKTCFWRTAGLSGTVFSDYGPLRQVWDNSTSNGVYCLAGFIFDDDLKFLKDEDTIRTHILPQLISIFGTQAECPDMIYFKSWRDEEFVNDTKEVAPVQQIPFGHSLVIQRHGERVVFAGTETAPGEHGHMNGAVVAGERAASEVLGLLIT